MKYSVSELSDRLAISERSVHRYIAAFREAGFVIPRPEDGRYSIKKNSPKFKEMSQLLHFSEEEAYILSKAIHSIDDVNVLKINLVKKLYALYDFDQVAVTVVKRENSENVHRLIQAIREKKQVILKNYQSANSDLVSDRLIEPFEFTTNYISVWGFDTESNSNKTFKTPRIAEVIVLPQEWKFEQFHKTKPIDVFRISGEPTQKVKLLLTLRAMTLLTEEYPLAEKFITPTGHSHYLFESFVCGWEGVGRFVLGLCNEVEILEPEELNVFLKEKIKKITAPG